MDPRKEEWKDEILDSLSGMQAAEPNPFLFAKIKSKLKSPIEYSRQQLVSKTTLAWAIAGIALLVCLNIFAVNQLLQEDVTYTEVITTDDNALVFEDYISTYADEAGYTQ